MDSTETTDRPDGAGCGFGHTPARSGEDSPGPPLALVAAAVLVALGILGAVGYSLCGLAGAVCVPLAWFWLASLR